MAGRAKNILWSLFLGYLAIQIFGGEGGCDASVFVNVHNLVGTLLFTSTLSGDGQTRAYPVTGAGEETQAVKVGHGENQSIRLVIVTQPATQTCALDPSDGYSINCVTNGYSVSVAVTGLSGTLKVKNNGADETTITTNGTTAFATKVASAAAYAVTISSQPGTQVCTLSGATGTIASANVTVNVACANAVFLYLTTALVQGQSIGGITGAKTLCAAGKPAGFTCSRSNEPFLGDSETNHTTLTTFPTSFSLDGTLPVYQAPDRVKLADNWAGLFGGTIQNAFTKTQDWYSGSKSDGTGDTNCNDWSAATLATIGTADATGAAWIRGDNSAQCTTARAIACVCY